MKPTAFFIVLLISSFALARGQSTGNGGGFELKHVTTCETNDGQREIRSFEILRVDESLVGTLRLDLYKGDTLWSQVTLAESKEPRECQAQHGTGCGGDPMDDVIRAQLTKNQTLKIRFPTLSSDGEAKVTSGADIQSFHCARSEEHGND